MNLKKTFSYTLPLVFSLAPAGSPMVLAASEFQTSHAQQILSSLLLTSSILLRSQKEDLQKSIDALGAIDPDEFSVREVITRTERISFLNEISEIFNELESVLHRGQQKANVTLERIRQEESNMHTLEMDKYKALQKANEDLRHSKTWILKKEEEITSTNKRYNTLAKRQRESKQEITKRWNNAFRAEASYVFPVKSELDKFCNSASSWVHQRWVEDPPRDGPLSRIKTYSYFIKGWNHALHINKEVSCSRHVYDTCLGYSNTIQSCKKQTEQKEKSIIHEQQKRDTEVNRITKLIRQYRQSNLGPNRARQEKITKEHHSLKAAKKKMTNSNNQLKVEVKSTAMSFQATIDNLALSPLKDIIKETLEKFEKSRKLAMVRGLKVERSSYQGGEEYICLKLSNALKIYSIEAQSKIRNLSLLQRGDHEFRRLFFFHDVPYLHRDIHSIITSYVSNAAQSG